MTTKLLISLLTIALLVIFVQTMTIANIDLQIHSFGSKLAVCHSITEDSDIYDCDYQNGAWYQK
jgi:hypothetical protein